MKKKNNDIKAFKEIAKEFPIIQTKPFFWFGLSMTKLKEKLTR